MRPEARVAKSCSVGEDDARSDLTGRGLLYNFSRSQDSRGAASYRCPRHAAETIEVELAALHGPGVKDTHDPEGSPYEANCTAEMVANSPAHVRIKRFGVNGGGPPFAQAPQFGSAEARPQDASKQMRLRRGAIRYYY